MMKTLFSAVLALTLAAGAQAMGRKPPQKDGAKEGPAAAKPQEARVEKSADITASGSWKGSQSGINDFTSFLVEDDANWQKLWTGYMKREAPKVDFSKHFAACVFLGLRPTGGFGVEFLPPALDDATATVRFRVSPPGQGSFVTQAFTTPFSIQLYKKSGRTLKLVEEKK